MLHFLLVIVGIALGVLPILSFFLADAEKDNFFNSIKSSTPKVVSLFVLSIVAFILAATLTFVRPGHQLYVVTPTGTEKVYAESGYKFIPPFSRIQEWGQWLDVKTIVDGESSEGIEGVLRPINIRFIDQVTASLKVSMRVKIPQDPASFINLVKTYRHPQNLANNTLIPTLNEQAFNVAQMFRAEAYVSGAAQDFRQTLDDALKNGAFVVDRTEIRDTIYEELNNEDVLNNNRAIKEVQTRISVEKRYDKNGLAIREPHDITRNNLIIEQVIVDEVLMEDKFRKKLSEQRDISAEKSIEAQKIETAKIAQQRIVAEGERDKAAERVSQEKEQVAKLINIETKVKEEESKRQLARIALETEKLESQRRKVAADAKRYELQQADGLSEEAKYRIDKEVQARISVAEAIAGPQGIKLPSTVISGGSSKGNESDLTNLLLLKMLEQKPLKN